VRLLKSWMRCFECGWVSIKRAENENGFYCQNPKCNVRLILTESVVIKGGYNA